MNVREKRIGDFFDARAAGGIRIGDVKRSMEIRGGVFVAAELDIEVSR